MIWPLPWIPLWVRIWPWPRSHCSMMPLPEKPKRRKKSSICLPQDEKNGPWCTEHISYVGTGCKSKRVFQFSRHVVTFFETQSFLNFFFPAQTNWELYRTCSCIRRRSWWLVRLKMEPKKNEEKMRGKKRNRGNYTASAFAFFPLQTCGGITGHSVHRSAAWDVTHVVFGLPTRDDQLSGIQFISIHASSRTSFSWELIVSFYDLHPVVTRTKMVSY